MEQRNKGGRPSKRREQLRRLVAGRIGWEAALSADDVQIVQQYLAGKTPLALGVERGVSGQTIRYWLFGDSPHGTGGLYGKIKALRLRS